MNSFKKVFFTLLPALILFIIIEGGARIYWNHLENEVFKQVEESNIANLKKEKDANKIINFIKMSHPSLGYVLIPNFKGNEDIITNSQGFFQKEEVELKKKEKSLRIMTVGESTTQGASVQKSSYPVSLKKFMQKSSHSKFPGGIEIINAGVQGWLSDQWAMATHLKFAAYKPDIVIFYCGWNDFQSYTPYSPPPQSSNFEDFSGYSAKYVFASNLKSVILLSDWFKAKKEAFKAKHNIGQLSDSAKAELKRPGVEKPKELYKFFTRNLTEAINTFKEHNPNVKIIISTLVGRWPHDTQEQFQSNLGHTWWMVDNRTTRKEAAGFLELLNGVIQDYAKENGLYFVDMRKSFDGLDKQKLFTDFCHLTNEGYEIIAKTFFDYIQKEVEPLQ